MSSISQNEKAKSGRSSTSCLECQRRKQKVGFLARGSQCRARLTPIINHLQCSREWPCNHCQARKVPHLCQFVAKKVHTPDNGTETGPIKYVTTGTISPMPRTSR